LQLEQKAALSVMSSSCRALDRRADRLDLLSLPPRARSLSPPASDSDDLLLPSARLRFARFLIVATFLEDALRIFTQFSDQLWYLQTCVLSCLLARPRSSRLMSWRSHVRLSSLQPAALPLGYLAPLPHHQCHRASPSKPLVIWALHVSTVSLTPRFVDSPSAEQVMTTCSILVIQRKYPTQAVGGLLGVVVGQALGYGLIFDLSFFLRNLSVIGGLLMVLSDSLGAKKQLWAGLPSLSETDRKK
jgi:hypothetical protein